MIKSYFVYNNEAYVLVPRHASNCKDYLESTLEDGVLELDLERYKTNASAVEFAQQKNIMVQHFEYIIVHILKVRLDFVMCMVNLFV